MTKHHTNISHFHQVKVPATQGHCCFEHSFHKEGLKTHIDGRQLEKGLKKAVDGRQQWISYIHSHAPASKTSEAGYCVVVQRKLSQSPGEV